MHKTVKGHEIGNLIGIPTGYYAGTENAEKVLVSGNARPCSIIFANSINGNARSAVHIDFNHVFDTLVNSLEKQSGLKGFVEHTKSFIETNLDNLLSFYSANEEVKINWAAGPLENKLGSIGLAKESSVQVYEASKIALSTLSQESNEVLLVNSLIAISKELGERMVLESIANRSNQIKSPPNIFRAYTPKSNNSKSGATEGVVQNLDYFMFDGQNKLEKIEFECTSSEIVFFQSLMENSLFSIRVGLKTLEASLAQHNSPDAMAIHSGIMWDTITSEAKVVQPNGRVKLSEYAEPATWESQGKLYL